MFKNSAVERAARAGWEHEGAKLDPDSPEASDDWETTSESARNLWRGIAAAMLKSQDQLVAIDTPPENEDSFRREIEATQAREDGGLTRPDPSTEPMVPLREAREAVEFSLRYFRDGGAAANGIGKREIDLVCNVLKDLLTAPALRANREPTWITVPGERCTYAVGHDSLGAYAEIIAPDGTRKVLDGPHPVKDIAEAWVRGANYAVGRFRTPMPSQMTRLDLIEQLRSADAHTDPNLCEYLMACAADMLEIK